MVWVGVVSIAGRLFCSWISDLMGRRKSVVVACLVAAATMSLGGYLNNVYVAGISVFYLMVLAQSFFGSGNYSIVGPYMAEVWPARLRASAWARATGSAISASSSAPRASRLTAGPHNTPISLKATLDALVPVTNQKPSWYLVGAAAIWFIGLGDKRPQSTRTSMASSRAANRPKLWQGIRGAGQQRRGRRLRRIRARSTTKTGLLNVPTRHNAPSEAISGLHHLVTQSPPERGSDWERGGGGQREEAEVVEIGSDDLLRPSSTA